MKEKERVRGKSVRRNKREGARERGAGRNETWKESKEEEEEEEEAE